jgi:hypothetical protein
MDKAINDTGCLQNKHQDKPTEAEASAIRDELFNADFETFETPLDLPRRVLPIYKPGDVVKGYVNLKLKEAVKADSLTLNFLGAGVVNIRIYHKHGYYDDTRHEKYVDDTKTLWMKTGLKPEKEEEFSSLVSDAPQSGDVLPAGNHRWPFEFTIPHVTSQSTPNLHPSSAHYCFVIYRIKAKLDSGKALGRGDVVTHKGLWVEKLYDIASDPENLLPVTQEEVLDTGIIFKSGKISIRATLPRKAFKKGEHIPLELIIDNQTSGKIDKVTAYIAMHGKFRLSDSRCTCSKSLNVKGAKQTVENVSAGMAPSKNWTLAWDFSGSSVDSNLMPTGTLDDCKLIEVKYDVVVKVKRSGLHRNMELHLPIYVGNYNSKE